MDYLVPMPWGVDADGSGPAERCGAVLSLTFATPVEAMAEQLVGLFDAIASTVGWQA